MVRPARGIVGVECWLTVDGDRDRPARADLASGPIISRSTKTSVYAKATRSGDPLVS